MEVGLAVSEQSEVLETLARSHEAADRERLLMAMVDLCEGVHATNPAEIDAAQSPLGDLFMTLVIEAEHEVRRRLAERISATIWAPLDLVKALALDEIEIARPVIALSPLLKDEDLIRLLTEATLDHQIEVARRPGIGAPVVDAIIEGADPLVMTALAANTSAAVGPEAMRRMVEESRRAPALRSPLARHPLLTPDLAERLYTWVGESLKAAIAARFRIDGAALDRAVAQTLRDIHTANAPPSVAAAEDREAMEGRLVDKLHDAGQLRSGYLLRALREHKLSLFEAALAKLSGLTRADVRRAAGGDRPELLALACLAAGIDRSVFPTVLDLVRRLNSGLPSGGIHGERRAMDMFTTYAPEAAAPLLRQVLAG